MTIKETSKLRSALLRQEIRRSPIHDLREMTVTNGRIFPTSTTVLSPDLAPSVPTMDGLVDLWGHRVDNSHIQSIFKHNQCTVLSLNMSDMGSVQIQPYKDILPRHVPILDVHVIVGWLKGFLFSRWCRKQLLTRLADQPNMQSSTFCMGLPKPGLFGDLGAWNRYGGFVYLIDRDGKARWRASGPPVEQDLQYYINAIKLLQQK